MGIASFSNHHISALQNKTPVLFSDATNDLPSGGQPDDGSCDPNASRGRLAPRGPIQRLPWKPLRLPIGKRNVRWQKCLYSGLINLCSKILCYCRNRSTNEIAMSGLCEKVGGEITSKPSSQVCLLNLLEASGPFLTKNLVSASQSGLMEAF